MYIYMKRLTVKNCLTELWELARKVWTLGGRQAGWRHLLTSWCFHLQGVLFLLQGNLSFPLKALQLTGLGLPKLSRRGQSSFLEVKCLHMLVTYKPRDSGPWISAWSSNWTLQPIPIGNQNKQTKKQPTHHTKKIFMGRW